MAASFELGNKLTFGILPVPLTSDQVKSLSIDNIPSGEFLGFEELGIEPASMGSILPEYLWPFRVSGQFADIKASAKNLKP
jgi:NADH dehydrogenase